MTSVAHSFDPRSNFAVRGDDLLIGGQTLRELAQRAGGTPFYAYDRTAIERRVQMLRTALPEGIGIHYAIKANPMPAVVQHLARWVDGLDVASIGELRLALDTGLPASAISFAGPGKRQAELEAAVATGICINLESETEFRRLVDVSQRLGKAARVAVRVNPDFELRASGMKMAGGPKPFGIDAERVPALLQAIGASDLQFLGFHIFTGSQNLRAESLVEAHRQTVALGLRLAEHAPQPVTLFNIGGGFGIPYFPGEHPLELGPIAENLAQLLPGIRQVIPHAEVVLELGRYLVGEAGVYVAEVIDRKHSRGELFLVTNGGLHHHLAASGNFGQVIRKNFPLAVGTRMAQPATETVHVVGPLCTPLDLLGAKVTLPRAEVGDLIVVFQSGAYGRTASPVDFLSHPPPGELFV